MQSNRCSGGVRVPWPHQVRGLDALERLRAEGHRSAYLEIGTGGGKTDIAAQDALSHIQDRPEGKILWVAHRGELLDQAATAFRRLMPEARVRRRIRAKGNGPLDFSDTDVLIASKQTLARRLTRLPKDAFHYLVIDEAHHAYAQGYLSILEHFQTEFTLGVTATPRRHSDRKHISDLFGPCALEMNLLELIKADILVPDIIFRRVMTNVEVEARLSSSGDFYLPSYWNQIKGSRRNALIVETYLGLEERKRTQPALCYGMNIKDIEEQARLFRQAGVAFEAIHGKLSRRERKRILRAFHCGDLMGLTSRDILNEGYDFPPIETILMGRPTRSKTVWLQQMGRGTRKSPRTGKANLLVVDFVDNVSLARMPVTAESIFKRAPSADDSRQPKTEKTQFEEARIHDIVEMDLDEVFEVLPLQPGELSPSMLADRLGRKTGQSINNAVRDGRLEKFVRRTVVISGGHESFIFHEDDLEEIGQALESLQPLPHELNIPMLANKVGVAYSSVRRAIEDGRLRPYVRRFLPKTGSTESPIFDRKDVEAIRAILTINTYTLELAPHEMHTGMMAEATGVSRNSLGRAIKDGRIDHCVVRWITTRGKQAPIFDRKFVDEIRAVFKPKTNELFAKDMARLVGLSSGQALETAMAEGRVPSSFVVRKIRIRGKDMPLFDRKDVEAIKMTLGPIDGELTAPMLSRIVGVSYATIYNAIEDGRIISFVVRRLPGKRATPIFRIDDVAEIKRILGK